jgi:hypothetical protein
LNSEPFARLYLLSHFTSPNLFFKSTDYIYIVMFIFKRTGVKSKNWGLVVPSKHKAMSSNPVHKKKKAKIAIQKTRIGCHKQEL